jgi:hypothetical protein
MNVHFLALVICHVETQLLHTGLDCVPASQTRGKVDVTSQTEIGRVENLVGAGVVEDGLGVDAGLVGEGTETRDGVVEGSVDLDGLGHQILNLLDHVKLVLALNVVGGRHHHSGQETAKRGDAIALTDTQHTSVDMSRTSLESAESVGNTATGVVVEMGLDVTRDDTAECPDKLVDLSGGSASNGIGNTDTVHTNLVDGLVQRQQVDKV